MLNFVSSRAARFGLSAAAALVILSPTAAAEAPVCDDADLVTYVKTVAAGVTTKAEAAPGDQAVIAEVAAGLTLSDFAEDSNDPATLTRVCYANVTSATVTDFNGGGLLYTVVGEPGTAAGVQVKVDVIPKR